MQEDYLMKVRTLKTKQMELFNFIVEYPYCCYFCMRDGLGALLNIITRRANILWKDKKVVDKWSEEPCSICGAIGRYTFTVKPQYYGEEEELEEKEEIEQEFQQEEEE